MVSPATQPRSLAISLAVWLPTLVLGDRPPQIGRSAPLHHAERIPIAPPRLKSLRPNMNDARWCLVSFRGKASAGVVRVTR